jgi:hypothetical protein
MILKCSKSIPRQKVSLTPFEARFLVLLLQIDKKNEKDLKEL